MKSLLALCILMPATVGLAADAQPTLPETITYITDKLANLPYAVWYSEKTTKREMYGMKVEWFNAGNLSLLVSLRRTEQGGSAEVKSIRYQLPLATLSTVVEVVQSPAAESTTPVAYGVVISSEPPPQGTIAPGTILVQEGGGNMQPAKKITLWFKSQDTAKRLADAFKHAIELSGGKKELFGN